MSGGAVVDHQGAAVTVTMNWPEKRNALGPEEGAALAEAIREASSSDASALVLTGSGAFCAGGDLRAFHELSAQTTTDAVRETVYGTMQDVVRALAEAPVPTIAAVDGPAIGLGFDYALACDMRLVGPGGWFSQGWARAGLIPGVGGIGLLQRLNGSVLWQLVATQQRVDGPMAADLRIGEVTDGLALDAAVHRAEQLASIPRDVLTHYCRLSRVSGWPPDEHFTESARIQAGLIGSERFRELSRTLLDG